MKDGRRLYTIVLDIFHFHFYNAIVPRVVVATVKMLLIINGKYRRQLSHCDYKGWGRELWKFCSTRSAFTIPYYALRSATVLSGQDVEMLDNVGRLLAYRVAPTAEIEALPQPICHITISNEAFSTLNLGSVLE